MITCIWTGHIPSCAEVEAECCMLAARSAADYLRKELLRTDLSAEMRADVGRRIGRYQAEAEHHAATIKRLQAAR